MGLMGLIAQGTLQHPPAVWTSSAAEFETGHERNKHQDPPAVPTLATADVETGSKVDEDRGRKALGEDVGELRRRRDVKDPDVSNGNPLADEVEINLDMLRALMLDRVSGEVHRADVVAVDEGAATKRLVELEE